MKNLFILLTAMCTVTFFASMVATPTVKTSPGVFLSGEDGHALPDSIMKIVKVSCMDCHAVGGNGMARAHVNLSEWTSYPPAKQADKAKDMCEMLTKGKMPPKKFRENNPKAVPTQAQINTICTWSKALNK